MYFLLVFVKLFRQTTEKGEGTKPAQVSEPLHRHHPVTSVIADRSTQTYNGRTLICVHLREYLSPFHGSHSIPYSPLLSLPPCIHTYTHKTLLKWWQTASLRVQNRIEVQMHDPWMLVETTLVTEFEYYFACIQHVRAFTYILSRVLAKWYSQFQSYECHHYTELISF